jgi:hypothetical protein
MTCDIPPEAHPERPSTDPFIAQLRALRQSLRVEALELRYRLEELEYRLTATDPDDAG